MVEKTYTHTHTHHTTVPYIHYLYLNNEIALCVINMISTFKMLFIHPLIILCRKWKHLSVCTNVMFLYARKRDTNIDFYHRHHHSFSIIYMNDSVNREKWRVWARKNRNYGGKAGGEGGERLKHLTKFIWLVYDLSPEISNNGPGFMCTAFGRKIYQ